MNKPVSKKTAAKKPAAKKPAAKKTAAKKLAAKRRTAAKKAPTDLFSGVAPETVIKWYQITHLGRLIEDKAYLYIRAAKGWSYHAPFAGQAFALKQTFSFLTIATF